MSLVNELIQIGYLKTPTLIKAFRQIQRSDFVLPKDWALASLDQPLSIGFGQTISQPATVAMMLELLAPKSDEKILDVGSGSGWSTALLAAVVGSRGKVYGLERIEELKEFGEGNVAKYGFVNKGRVVMLLGDGYAGRPKEAPFDRILVSAAARAVPQNLLKQLKVGGRLVMPIGRPSQGQALTVVNKLGENTFEMTEEPGFAFVPLVKN